MKFNPSEMIFINNHIMGIMFQAQGNPVDDPNFNQIVHLLLSKIMETHYLKTYVVTT